MASGPRPAEMDVPTAELEALIVRLARENPRMSFDKIQGELLKLGYAVDRSTVRNGHAVPSPLTSARARTEFLAHLPHPLPNADARLRFLHHRNDRTADPLCLILH